jgi:multidrug efflux pump subunit AcrA (membrane-fusion protein)
MKKHHWPIAEIGATLLLGVSASQMSSCSRTSAAAAEPTPPDVEVATVEQKDIPVYREWIGTLDGQVNAAIRAQVTGYLLTQNYSEGSLVKKGQLLSKSIYGRFKQRWTRQRDSWRRRPDS